MRVTLSGKLVDPCDGTEKFNVPGVKVIAWCGWRRTESGTRQRDGLRAARSIVRESKLPKA